MATDKSEPRVGLIFRFGFLVIIALIGTRAALTAYFDQIASAEELRKHGQVVPEALINLRADEERRLTGAPLPIEKAMQDMVSKGRMGSPDIVPSASRDVAPMQGWTKLPGEVPPMMTAAPPPEAVDGGPAVAPAADGGANAAGPDAGPNKKPTKNQP
jgi:hypothetical protein